MIVVDATVVCDLLISDGEPRKSALKLATMDPEWISVSLWRYEFGNVLWKSIRAGLLEPEKVSQAWVSAERLVMETIEEIHTGQIHAISQKHGLTFYDASYVWLGRCRGLELRTRDQQILRECSDVACAMPGN